MKCPDWLKKLLAWLAGTGAVIALFLTGKKMLEEAIFGKVEKPTNWLKITPTTISVYDKTINMYRRVKLPIDRRTNERVRPENIKAVGVTEKGGKVNVEIKHDCITDILGADADTSTDPG